jgi:chromosome segregation ATPase
LNLKLEELKGKLFSQSQAVDSLEAIKSKNAVTIATLEEDKQEINSSLNASGEMLEELYTEVAELKLNLEQQTTASKAQQETIAQLEESLKTVNMSGSEIGKQLEASKVLARAAAAELAVERTTVEQTAALLKTAKQEYASIAAAHAALESTTAAYCITQEAKLVASVADGSAAHEAASTAEHMVEEIKQVVAEGVALRANLEAEVSKLKANMEMLEMDAEDQMAMLDDATAQIENLTASKASLESQLESTESTVVEGKTTITDQEARITELEALAVLGSTAAAELLELKSVHTGTVDNLKAQIASITASVSSGEGAQLQLNDALAASADKVADLFAELETSERKLANATKACTKLEGRIAEVEAEALDAKESWSNGKTHAEQQAAELQTAIQSLQAENSTLTDKVSSLDSDVFGMMKDLEISQTEVVQTQSCNTHLEQELASCKETISALTTTCTETQAQISQLKESITATDSAAKLTESEHTGVVAQQKQDFEVLSATAAAEATRADEAEQKCSEFDAECIALKEAAGEASVAAAEQQQTLELEMADAQEQVTALKQQVVQLEGMVSAFENDADAETATKLTLTAELTGAQQMIEEMEISAENNNETIFSLKSQAAAIQTTNDELLDRKSEVEAALEIAKKSVAKLETDAEVATAEIRKLGEQLTSKTALVEEIEAAAAEADAATSAATIAFKSALAKKDVEIEMLKEDAEDTLERAENAEAKSPIKRKEIGGLTERIFKLTEEVEEKEAQIVALQNQVEDASLTSTDMSDKYATGFAEKETTIVALQEELTAIVAEMDASKEQAMADTEIIAELQSNLNVAISRMQETKDENVAAYIELGSSEATAAAATAELKALKQSAAIAAASLAKTNAARISKKDTEIELLKEDGEDAVVRAEAAERLCAGLNEKVESLSGTIQANVAQIVEMKSAIEDASLSSSEMSYEYTTTFAEKEAAIATLQDKLQSTSSELQSSKEHATELTGSVAELEAKLAQTTEANEARSELAAATASEQAIVHHATVETMSAEAVAAAAAASEKYEATVAQKDVEIEMLKEDHEDAVACMLKRAEFAEVQSANLTETVDQLTATVLSNNAEIAQLQSTIKDASSSSSDMSDKYATTFAEKEAAIATLQDELKAATVEADASDAHGIELKNHIDELQSNLNAAIAKIQATKEDATVATEAASVLAAEELSAAANNAELAAAEAAQELAAIISKTEVEIGMLKEDGKETLARAEEAETEAADCVNLIETLSTQIANNESQIEALKRSVDAGLVSSSEASDLFAARLSDKTVEIATLSDDLKTTVADLEASNAQGLKLTEDVATLQTMLNESGVVLKRNATESTAAAEAAAINHEQTIAKQQLEMDKVVAAAALETARANGAESKNAELSMQCAQLGQSSSTAALSFSEENQKLVTKMSELKDDFSVKSSEWSAQVKALELALQSSENATESANEANVVITADLNAAKQTLEEIESTLASTMSSNAEKITALQTEFDTLKLTHSTLELKSTELDAALQTAVESLVNAEASAAKASAESASAIQALHEEVNAQTTHAADLAAAIDSAAATAAATKTEHASEITLKDTKISALNAHGGATVSRAQAAEQQCTDLQNENAGLTTTIVEKEARITALLTLVDEASTQTSSYQEGYATTFADLNSTIATTEARLEVATSRAAQADFKVTELEQQVVELELSVEEKDIEICGLEKSQNFSATLFAQYNALEQEMEASKVQCAELESTAEDAMAMLSSNSEEYEMRKSEMMLELATATVQYTAASARADGAELQCTDLAAQKQRLEESVAAQLVTIAEFESAIDAAEVVSEEQLAVISEKKVTICLLEEQREALVSRAETAEEACATLQSQCDVLTETKETNTATIAELERAAEDATAASVATEAVHTALVEERDGQIETMAVQEQATVVRAETSEAECTVLTAKCADLEVSLESTSTRLAQVDAAFAAASTAAAEMSTNHTAAIAEQAEDHSIALAEQTEAMHVVVTNLQAATEGKQKAQAECEQLEQAAVILNGSISDLRAGEIELKSELDAARSTIEEITVAKDQVTHEFEALQQINNAGSAQLTEKVAHIAVLDKMVLEMQEVSDGARHDHDVAMHEVKNQIQVQTEKIESLTAANGCLDQTVAELKLLVEEVEAKDSLSEHERLQATQQGETLLAATKELAAEKTRSAEVFAQTSAKLELALERAAALGTEKQQLATDLEVLQAQSEQKLNHALQSAQADIDRLENENTELQANAGGLSEVEAAEKDGQLLEAKVELAVQQKRAASFETELKTAREELDTVETRCVDLTIDNEALQQQQAAAANESSPGSAADMEQLAEYRMLVDEQTKKIGLLSDALEQQTDKAAQLKHLLDKAQAREASESMSRHKNTDVEDEMRENMRRAEAEASRLKMENLQLQSKEKEHEAYVRSMQLETPAKKAPPVFSSSSSSSPAVGKVRSRHQLSPSGETPKRNARRPALPTDIAALVDAAPALVKIATVANADAYAPPPPSVVAPEQLMAVVQPVKPEQPAEQNEKPKPKGSAMERARARRALAEKTNANGTQQRQPGPAAKRAAAPSTSASKSGPQRVAASTSGPQRVTRNRTVAAGTAPAKQIEAALPNTADENPEECTSQ